MKLQYLGDARDAFKWDILHWVCTKSSPAFSRLVYIPMLTPPDNPNEGRIHHQQFACRDFIRPFVESLTMEPRSFMRVCSLGAVEPLKRFEVSVFAPERVIGIAARRREYWADFNPSDFDDSVIFFDPDNGFETKTQHAQKWIRHRELSCMIDRLPATSVAVVYQHRPHLEWDNVFAEIEKKIDYANSVAAHERDLAFVALAGNRTVWRRVNDCIKDYAKNHPTVKYRGMSHKRVEIETLPQALK
jgi:hypothetical protein